jgi:hypothetical protein
MSTDRIVVVIAKAGVQIGQHAVVTEAALKEMAAMATVPYLVYREETKDLVWDGPAEAYYEYFHHPSAEQAAKQAINRAMRKA